MTKTPAVGASANLSTLGAAHYADRACQQRVKVLENVQIARDTYRLRLDCPMLARRILPGQFLMLRLADCGDPLLARPFALYDTVLSDGDRGAAIGIDIVYLVVGKMTGRLAQCEAGQAIDVWGPLGNGFTPQGGGHLVMVAGGIGQTPFLALAREHVGQRHYGDPAREPTVAHKVTLCYGARTRDYLAGVDDFAGLGVEVRTSTDDGTAGHRGLVTELLEQVLAASPPDRVVCCGPERMMEAVSRIAAAHDLPCQVSLETPMACGIGICFSCVARVREGGESWDYRRTCVEGPVFEAARIVW